MLRNILGPIFNFNLDQFLTLEFVIFFSFFFLGGGLKPLFLIVFQQKCKIERNTKTKKDTICERCGVNILAKFGGFQSQYFGQVCFFQNNHC